MDLDEREVQFELQRKTYGFSDDETWSLDLTIAKFILPRLKRFRQIDSGVPSDLTEEQWHEILDKIIITFDMIVANDSTPTLFCDKEKMKIVDEGLDLFREWFFSLWW